MSGVPSTTPQLPLPRAAADGGQSDPVSDKTYMSLRVNSSGIPRLLLFFNYRTLFESADIDFFNFEAWKEVLDAFGYTGLTFERFLDEFALKSPAEIMKALCPFTTKAEWEPLLNKRETRLTRDVNNMCFAEVMPLSGIHDFIIDCNRNIPTVCIFVSPFNEAIACALLEKAELARFFDHVYNYTERDYALLEALEVLNAPPPHFPDGVHHRWERDARPEQPQDVIMSFECDSTGIKRCGEYGVRAIAISYNCSDGEGADAPTAALSQLLAAGASLAVKDFTTLKYEYLCYLP